MSFPIPADQMPFGATPWLVGTNTGIIGGIPARSNIVNVVGLVADSEAALDANNAAIAAAISAATEDDVVLIPAGNYWGAINVPYNKINITVRGAGMDTTTLIHPYNNGVKLGSGSDYGLNYPASGNIDTTGTHVRGDDTITIADTSVFYADAMVCLQIEINQDNSGIEDGSVPFVYAVRPLTNYLRKQMARVVSKTSGTVTFDPPLFFDAPGSDIKITLFQQIGYGVGIEDMTIDCSPDETQWALWGEQCYGCWFKNVRAYQATNYAFFFSNSLHCEIRGCFADERRPGGSNGAGILSNLVGCSLYEDNITYKFNPGIEVNEGNTGNAVLYNLFEDSRPTAGINSNHNPHNSFNLYEGNITPNIQCDGYYGSASEDSFYRNWITGVNGGDYVFLVGLNRFTRFYSLVANIIGTAAWPYGDNPYSMGNPNIGNGSFDGESQTSIGDFWGDWKATGTLTARPDATHGTITLDPPASIAASYNGVFFRLAGGAPADNLVMQYLSLTVVGDDVSFTLQDGVLPALSSVLEVYPGENGFQELDLEVEETTILKVNYHQWGSGGPGIPAGQELGADTLVNSLAYSSRPPWLPIEYPWPAFDPLDPGTPSYDNIPAGTRFLAEEPTSAPEIISQCTVSGLPSEGSLLTAIPGAVTGNPVPTRTWRWERDGVPILGATSITYLLTGDDVGFDVGPVQVETNSEGEDEFVATPLTITSFMGDQLVVTQVANAAPVTELWRRGALTSGISGPLEYYTVQHSGPYPTQPDNNYIYARFGTPQDNVYVFQGTISEAEAIASVP